MPIKVSEKKCSTCKKILPASEFYPHKRMTSGLQSNCRTCSRKWHKDRPEYIREKNAKYKEKNPDYMLNWARKKKYGLTNEQVLSMRSEQKGLCAGCLCLLTRENECIDHCHKTGKNRGLLCDSCNVSIGRLDDNPDTLRRLAEYLERNEKNDPAHPNP